MLLFNSIVLLFTSMIFLCTVIIYLILDNCYKKQKNNITNKIEVYDQQLIDNMRENIDKQELNIKQLNLEIEKLKKNNNDESFSKLENLVKNIEFVVYYLLHTRQKLFNVVNNTECLNDWINLDHMRIAMMYSLFIINKPKKNLYFYDSLKQYSENLDYDELVENFDKMIKENKFIKNYLIKEYYCSITGKFNYDPDRCYIDIFIKNYLSDKLSELNVEKKAYYINRFIIKYGLGDYTKLD